MSVESSYNAGFSQGLEHAGLKLASAYGIEKTALIDDLKRMVGTQQAPEQGLSGQEMALGGGSAAALGLGVGADALGDRLRGVENQLADYGFRMDDAQRGRKSEMARAQNWRNNLNEVLGRKSVLQQQHGALQGGVIPENMYSSSQNMLNRRLERLQGMDKAQVREGLQRFSPAELQAAKATRAPGEKIVGANAKDLLRRAYTQSLQPGINEDVASHLSRVEKGLEKNKKFVDSAEGYLRDSLHKAKTHRQTGQQLEREAKQLRGSGLGRLGGFVNSETMRGVGGGLKTLGALGGVSLLGKKLYDVATE